jgi:5-methylcytosine-specific restriction protein B
MARVRQFEQIASAAKAHPTEVDCGYQTVRAGGETLLQLSTYGSDLRQSEKKVSQTLQFDRDTATELVAIIRQTFPGL